MTTDMQITTIDGENRHIDVAQPFDKELGPFGTLPGRWVGQGRGWNMIALPFAQPGPLDYRLLLNQYDEELNFSLVDKAVPNRGVTDDHAKQIDQKIVTLDYEQVIHQVAVVDEPASTVTGLPGNAIHHEPGLFLHMKNRIKGDGFDIARLGTIPHGDAVLALGHGTFQEGLAPIPAIDGLPLGVNPDVENNPYLAPYKHFHDNPFKGNVGFPGLSGVRPGGTTPAPGGWDRGTDLHPDDGAGVRLDQPDRRDQEHPVRGQAGRRRLDEGDLLDPGAGPGARRPRRCCRCSTSRS